MRQTLAIQHALYAAIDTQDDDEEEDAILEAEDFK